MFVVACASFRLLYVTVILGHDRRKILHTAVTLPSPPESPSLSAFLRLNC
jgi:hypothetical protein